MTDQQDILIIGAGLIGLCTADELSARGARVRVVDARPGPCQGTSYSNSGMIHPSQAMSWDPNLSRNAEITRSRQDAARATARLGERSKELLLEKMRSLGLPARPTGCLQLHNNMDMARAAQSGYEDLGVKTNIVIDPVDTFGMIACQFPGDASGDARKFGCALASELVSRGVVFEYDAGELDFRRSDGEHFVRTAQGVFSSTHLVIAAGVQSGDCLARLGVRMILSAVPGAAADFDLPKRKEDLPTCPVMDAQSRSALTVFSDRVRISGGWGLDSPDLLLKRWQEIAPGLMLRLGSPRSTWSGIRPVSPVGRPYISGTSIPNLWVNTGHGHMGWTLCAGSGELLAQMILEGREDTRFAFSG